MEVLKEVACGRTVTVQKIVGRRCETQDHGYGYHKGYRDLCSQGGTPGDPMEVTVRGYELSLRKADAEMILVE